MSSCDGHDAAASPATPAGRALHARGFECPDFSLSNQDLSTWNRGNRVRARLCVNRRPSRSPPAALQALARRCAEDPRARPTVQADERRRPARPRGHGRRQASGQTTGSFALARTLAGSQAQGPEAGPQASGPVRGRMRDRLVRGPPAGARRLCPRTWRLGPPAARPGTGTEARRAQACCERATRAAEALRTVAKSADTGHCRCKPSVLEKSACFKVNGRNRLRTQLRSSNPQWVTQ